MEQTLTTIAFISAALFIVWILLVDPAAEDVHAGLDMTFLGALLMVPVIIFVLIGIALIFPVIVAIALIGLLLYGLFMLLRWFMTREQIEASSDPPKESRVLASLRRIEKGVKAIGKSRPVRAVQERVKESGTKVRAGIARNSEKARKVYDDRIQKVRESPKNFKENITRVRDGTVKKARAIREKMDRTIVAGQERSRMFRERGAKNTADVSEQTSKQKNAGNVKGDGAVWVDSEKHVTAQNRNQIMAQKREGASDVSRDSTSDRSAREAHPIASRDTEIRSSADQGAKQNRHSSDATNPSSASHTRFSTSDRTQTKDRSDDNMLDNRKDSNSRATTDGSDARHTQSSPSASNADSGSQDQSRKRASSSGKFQGNRTTDQTHSKAEDGDSSEMVRVSDGDHRASQSSDHQSTVKHSAGEKGGSVYQRSSQASQSTVQTSSSDSQAHDRSAKKAFESSKTSQGSASEGRNISVTDLSGKDSKDSHGVAGTSLVNNEEYSFPRDLQRSRIKRSGKEKFADAFQTKWSALKKRVSGEDSEGRLKSLQHDKKALERSTQSEEEHAYDRKRKKSLSLSDRFRDSKKRVQRGVGSSDVRTTSQAGVSSSRASSRSLHQRFASWTKNIFLKIDGRQEKRAALEGKGKHPQSRRGLRRSTDGDVDLFSEGYLRNMRPIGWKMRSKMDETYKKDAK